MIQVYMPTSEHEDDEVDELYAIIEEIIEEDGKGDTNTIIMGEWNSVVADESYRNIVGPHGLERNNHRGQMFINYCERNGLSPTHGSGNLREDCTHGRHQKIGLDISCTIYL
jgi:exonuclease III